MKEEEEEEGGDLVQIIFRKNGFLCHTSVFYTLLFWGVEDCTFKSTWCNSVYLC